MFGTPRSGAKAYANVGVETSVLAANPHKLISMLFEGALVALSTALHHMKSGNIAGKGQAIAKTMRIIDEGLRASLDKSVGEIAENLDALYEYMGTRLVMGNLKNDPEALEEVQRLLADLKEAWDQIAPKAAAPAPAPAAMPHPAAGYGAAVAQTASFVKA
ncbi:flagellar export chaperone FliS [Massilia aerilata]|uniref:Flagellar export chaperone FliS n=1 Tax=Massilia aerilata TaxID=453817 RepID=A0ABW0RWQ7_9BURK